MPKAAEFEQHQPDEYEERFQHWLEMQTFRIKSLLNRIEQGACHIAKTKDTRLMEYSREAIDTSFSELEEILVNLHANKVVWLGGKVDDPTFRVYPAEYLLTKRKSGEPIGVIAL